MLSDQWPRFAALLDEALELEPDRRTAWLSELTGPDAALRPDLEEWLRSETNARGFLEAPLAPGASWSRAPWAPHEPGDVLGNYRIVRLIGVGGTAMVYEAEQEEPRRRIALKVFQAGLAGTRSRERFAEEASILAGLRHAGIAQVFEAGTDGAGEAQRPWIAMELVAEALPLTRYARERGLSRRSRLELFALVCDAVAHGHARGVIHRDLKPANLLVDGSGQPKVIDFGVAKMLGGSGGPSGTAALTGGLYGTLPWMSPERLGAGAALPDTRADVYALGVVLHELLCGTLPHALEDLSLEDALRTLRDAPPVRLADVDSDLEAVVQVATARKPAARYASAAELAADLRRHLARQPVVARRPNVLHALRLAVARHRAAVGFAAVALVLLGFAWGFGALRTAQVEARERARANEVTRFLKSILALASPSTDSRGDLSMREVLDDASQRIEVELADAPDARAEVHALVGSAWRELGQLERSEEHLRSAAEVFRETRPGSAELAGALSMLSEVLLASGRGVESEEVLLEALELYRADPATPEFFLGIVTNKLAGAKRLQGELVEAERLAWEALEIYRRAFGESHVAVASAFDTLSVIQRDGGRLAQAEESAREALRIHLETAGPESLAVAQARVALARLLLARGADTDAVSLLEAARPALDRLLPAGHSERDEVGHLIESCAP